MKIQPLTEQLLAVATAYRRENKRVGGYVVVAGMEVQGWCSSLVDNSASWMPGTWAIDEAGNKWLAIGGNDYDGAVEWQAIPHDSFR